MQASTIVASYCWVSNWSNIMVKGQSFPAIRIPYNIVLPWFSVWVSRVTDGIMEGYVIFCSSCHSILWHVMAAAFGATCIVICTAVLDLTCDDNHLKNVLHLSRENRPFWDCCTRIVECFSWMRGCITMAVLMLLHSPIIAMHWYWICTTYLWGMYHRFFIYVEHVHIRYEVCPSLNFIHFKEESQNLWIFALRGMSLFGVDGWFWQRTTCFLDSRGKALSKERSWFELEFALMVWAYLLPLCDLSLNDDLTLAGGHASDALCNSND